MPNKPKINASARRDSLDSLNRKSKTQKKKEALSLQELGERLVKMPPEQIKTLNCRRKSTMLSGLLKQ